MPTKPFKTEVYILTAEAEAWLELEAMLTALDDPKWDGFLRSLRYKLWRTGHRPQPE